MSSSREKCPVAAIVFKRRNVFNVVQVFGVITLRFLPRSVIFRFELQSKDVKCIICHGIEPKRERFSSVNFSNFTSPAFSRSSIYDLVTLITFLLRNFA